MKDRSLLAPQEEIVEGPRSRIINSYLDTIQRGIQDNRSQIKLVNYGTGSGKTHQLFQAICETIKQYPDIQIVGVYVAPLREHLQVPERVGNQFPETPVY